MINGTRETVKVDLIDDNPYQPRGVYHKEDIDKLMASIKTNGLLQVPLARQVNGRVQLGFGHLRKRAFLKLAKEDPEKWGTMPLEILELSDAQMAIFALEENLKRRDITPIDTARAVDKYLVDFPDQTEQELATKLNMTQGNISNMRRVLRLPAKVTDRIDEGRINFTMARELLVFQDIESVGDDDHWGGGGPVRTPKDGAWLQNAAVLRIRPPDKEDRYGDKDPPTVEGMQRAIHSVARHHLYALEKEVVYSYISREPLFDTRETGCLKCKDMIRTHPKKSQTNHWCTKPACWDGKQKDHKKRVSAEAAAKLTQDVVQKVTAAETERQAAPDISQEITEVGVPLTEEELAVAVDEELETRDEQSRRVQSAKNLPDDYPCRTCMNVALCDRTTVSAKEGGGLECPNHMTKETKPQVAEKATLKLPPEIQEKVASQAGTRAQILDLHELRVGNWGHELKQGWQRLGSQLDSMDDPEECLERCIDGFHYAYDSGDRTPTVYTVCSKPTCISRKKAAFTRAKNAQGQGKKKAETKAIKRAVEETTAILDMPRMKLILLSQIRGNHTYHHGAQEHIADLMKRLGVESEKDILPAMNTLLEEDLAKVIVGFMLTVLTHNGEVNNYQVKTTEALNWLGIGVNVEEKGRSGS